ncbi:MAG: inactive transglutaminase family protein [Sulfurimonas sp.]|nr:inactive transglutaminase family protein [Sulfurimonas sp.]
MTSKLQIYLFSFLLIFIAVATMAYKVKYLDFPLFSGEDKSIFNIEAKIKFEGTGENAFISLALNEEQDEMFVYNESASSLNYGYTTAQVDGYKRAEWAKRHIRGTQTIYYSIDVIEDSSYISQKTKKYISSKPLDMNSIMTQATIAIMDDAEINSADDLSMTAKLIEKFAKEEPTQAVGLFKRRYIHSDNDLRNTLVTLLKFKNVQVRRLGVLKLKDGQKNVKLTPMLEIFSKNRWQLFDIHTGKIDRPENLFVWQRGGVSLLDAEGVINSKVSFSISENAISSRRAALLKSSASEISLMDFSLFILPNESQNAFKQLLLIPIGALVVVLLRVLIGVKTSGTFMSVLIAMAFMQTQLIPGLIMFLSVVSLGLIVRSYLSYLNLLLVARISAVLIIVVGIMAVLAVIAFKLGFEDAITITFFPMIILAWTIERMSIVWEEDGAKEVFMQGGGSLIVAVLAYFVMINPIIQFWTFNFPEFLLAVLGVIILVGRYSGYRLSELYRFASMVKKK